MGLSGEIPGRHCVVKRGIGYTCPDGLTSSVVDTAKVFPARSGSRLGRISQTNLLSGCDLYWPAIASKPLMKQHLRFKRHLVTRHVVTGAGQFVGERFNHHNGIALGLYAPKKSPCRIVVSCREVRRFDKSPG